MSIRSFAVPAAVRPVAGTPAGTALVPPRGASIWAKREDCNSGIAFGGNKTRKLEYLVADALAAGCDTLVSIGGVQSNHTRQVAAVAARAGLKCVLIQESWVDWPDPVYDKVGNILISRLAGADVRLVRAEFGIGFKESWDRALREIEDAGGRSYAIPAGASDHPLAAWDSPAGPTRSPSRSDLGVLLRHGIPDAATLDAMRLAARTEGMVTDPVYEGKSMAATIDLVSTGEIPRDATVLYAHPGGQPALNAYSALFS
jgi:1-aminocyclopropane-1-carboxylate deaminase/D-cysteine desulfhydrase-like pyridoxal-dependent ACC family enzyme